MRNARRKWLLVLLVAPVGAACSAVLDLQPPPIPDVPDAGGTTDAGADAPVPVCAPADVGDGVTWFPLRAVADDDAGKGGFAWFDVTALKPAAKSFAGGTFVAPYVYFAERGGGVVRYDTTGDFASPGSWLSFNLSSLMTLPSTGVTFEGAVFDGRYVYFVPAGTGANESVVARYDTTLDFTTPTSWATFLTTSLAADAGPVPSGFAGGGFDGRYLYLVPHYDGAADGNVVRYDTRATDFTNTARWSTFDVAATITPPPAAPASGFWGAVFDGTYVYFAPLFNGYTAGSGIALRFQADGGFAAKSSWTTFDLTTVNGLADDFAGAGFDGTYVYFAPHANGIVARFDPSLGAFNSAPAWSTYDLTRSVLTDAAPMSAGYSGTAYDGRFVYFIPTGTYGTLARYDTKSTFSTDCAWSAADLVDLVVSDAGASASEGFNGAVFDGQYLYLIPQNGVFFRFQAKTPASMPVLPYFHGSFY